MTGIGTTEGKRIGTKARGANRIRYPSSPSRKRWILGVVRIDLCSAIANALSIPPGETLPGLDMPRILLKERGAFGNTDTGGAWLSSAHATAGDKLEEGEDDVKSSCPLCLGRHICYNGRDKGSRSCEVSHTAVNLFPGLVHTARHTMGSVHARSRYLNRKEGDAEGRTSDWSEVVTRPIKKGATSELNLEMEVFFRFSTVKLDQAHELIISDQELRDHPFHSGVTEGSYHSSLFFHAFPRGLEKADIKWDVSIYLSLDSKWEQGQLTTESDFAIIFISVIVRKEGPAPSCSRIVSLSFSTLCLRISQFYFSMGTGKGYNSAVECHLDVVEVISSSLIIPKPNGWLYFWERTPGEYEAHGYKLGLGMKDNSESALSTNKEAITTLGLRHGPDSYGRQQWGIFRNGRKPDGAMPRGAAVIQRMQALSGMIGRKASVGGFLSPPSNPRAQLWTGGGNYQAGVRGANGIRYPSSPSRKRWILGAVRIDPCSAVANALSIPPGETLPGLDMPRILLKERGAFGNADTGGAWLSSARATAGDKPEEGEDDVKSSCPLCPGRHTCYNGRDKGSRSREGELTPKTRPQFGLQAATRLHEAGIASNRRRYLNRKEGDAEGRASDWSEVVTRALSHMDSSMCSSAPDPEMWIIQGTLAWRTPPVRTGKAEIKWDVSIYLSLDSKWEQSYFTKTCHGKEEGGNRHTWRAQYNGELYAAFGKDESLPKRNLLILSQLDGPAAPGKRIEEASDSFMHAPLGSGGYSSVGRAPLLQLGRCDYGLDV
ncbi:hypothetical protein Tco_1104223 [Tanacetum coccineum]